MKPRNRDISIFNLSMMDVISGAMAAFLILVVILAANSRSKKLYLTPKMLALQNQLIQASARLSPDGQMTGGEAPTEESITHHLMVAHRNMVSAENHLSELTHELEHDKKKLKDYKLEMAIRRPYIVSTIAECQSPSHFVIQAIRVNAATKWGTVPPTSAPASTSSDAGFQVWNADPVMNSRSLLFVTYRATGDQYNLFFRRLDHAHSACQIAALVSSPSYLNIDKNLQNSSVSLDHSATIAANQTWLYIGNLAIESGGKIAFNPGSP